MFQYLPLAGRTALADAQDLITLYGEAAADEAAARARKCRDVGNVITFCRWREAARAIAILAVPEEIGTIH